MSSLPIVSVVFPIYNNEKYLEKCVRSVMDQTLDNIELILIDDGSTDSVPVICDRLAEEDNRLHVIHKKNEGSAAGRNLGIELARGQFVAFVESDDSVEPDMYEKLVACALETDADIVKCGFWICEGEKREYTSFYELAAPGETFTAVDKPEIFMFHASIWGGIYRREFIEKNALRFIVTPSATYSDFSWMATTYANAKKITICHEPLYNYSFDNPLASNKRDSEKCYYKPFHCLQANRILREAGIFLSVREQIGYQEYKTCIHHTKMIRTELREEYFKRFREVLLDLCREEGFRFKYFNSKERRVANQLLNSQSVQYYREMDFKKRLRRIIRLSHN